MAFFTGLAAAIGLTGVAATTFVAVGTNLLVAAVGYIGSTLIRSLSGESQSSSFGVSGQISSGGDVPRTLSFGKFGTSGSLVYHGTWGTVNKTPNAYYVQVICVGDTPINGLVDVFLNNEKLTVITGTTTAMGHPIQEYRKDGVDYAWVKFYDGTQTVADSYLVSKFGTSEHEYGEDRIGTGCPYVIMTYRTQEDLYSGFPSAKFTLNGRKLYDISKDSSVGGVGLHRWGDMSTWGGDGDHLVAVQIYNLLRGITYAGKWHYGLQNTPAARLPAADWIAAVDKCRQPFDGPNGSEPQYRAGGELPINSRIADAIEALLTASQGRLASVGGVFKLKVGSAGTSVATFSDEDIQTTSEQSFTPFFGLADTVNCITARYPEPDEGWATKVAPPRYSPTFEAQDGNRQLPADITFDLVPYKSQVQRLMKSALAEARRARRLTFTLPPWAYILEPGDIVTYNSEANGFVSKKFRVDGVMDCGNLDVIVDITEVDPTDYDWNQDTDYRTPIDGPTVTVRVPPQPIIDWNAVAYAIDDDTGQPRRPAILITWDGDQDDVQQVEWQVRLFTTEERVTEGSTHRVSNGGAIVSAGILNITHYQARGRYVPTVGRPALWSDWIDVITLDIRIGAEDVYDGVFDYDKFATEIKEWMESTAQADLDIWDELNAIQLATTDIDMARYENFETLNRNIVSSFGAITASYKEDIIVATGPNSALANRLTTMEATIPTLASSTAVEELDVRVQATEDTIDSQATYLLTLESRVTDNELGLDGQATATQGLQTRVTNAEGVNSAQATQLTSLASRMAFAETGLVGQSSATQALTTRVTNAEGVNTSQASAITGLTSRMVNEEGKSLAASTAINGLNTTVSDHNGRINTNASAITSLKSSYDSVSANATFRMTTAAGVDGYASRIVLQARVGSSGSWSTAGLYIDVNASSSRLTLLASRLILSNGSDFKRPFMIQDGIVYMDQVMINGGKIVELTVGTLQVSNNAISDTVANFAAGGGSTYTTSGSEIVLQSASVAPQGGDVLIQGSFTTWLTGINSNRYLKIRVYRGGTMINEGIQKIDTNWEHAHGFNVAFVDENAGNSTYTYTIRIRGSNEFGTDTTLGGQCECRDRFLQCTVLKK